MTDGQVEQIVNELMKFEKIEDGEVYGWILNPSRLNSLTSQEMEEELAGKNRIGVVRTMLMERRREEIKNRLIAALKPQRQAARQELDEVTRELGFDIYGEGE